MIYIWLARTKYPGCSRILVYLTNTRLYLDVSSAPCNAKVSLLQFPSKKIDIKTCIYKRQAPLSPAAAHTAKNLRSAHCRHYIVFQAKFTSQNHRNLIMTDNQGPARKMNPSKRLRLWVSPKYNTSSFELYISSSPRRIMRGSI